MFSKPQPRGKAQAEKPKVSLNPAPHLTETGPEMAAQNANFNRRALGDIGNLVGALNSRCYISKEAEIAAQNVNANRRALGSIPNLVGPMHAERIRGSSHVQEHQVENVVARPDARIEAKVVWGSKQRRTMRTRIALPRGPTGRVNQAAAAEGDTEFKTAKECKLCKPNILTLTASLAARSDETFKEDLSIHNIDEGDEDNLLAVAEYVGDMYKHYKKSELLGCVPANYMSRQPELNNKMRAILVDWMIEVHQKFELMPETLYLAVNIVDRVLNLHVVPRCKLQLVGVTAMLIASKYEEIYAPQVSDYVEISANEYPAEQVRAMECLILRLLKFQLTVPTPYVFIARFLKAAEVDKEIEHMAYFLAELSLMQSSMLEYRPSMLAASAVYTAVYTLKRKPCWTRLLVVHTGYTEAELRECAYRMVNLHANAAHDKLKVVYKKYCNPCFGAVARIQPGNLPAEDSCSCS